MEANSWVVEMGQQTFCVLYGTAYEPIDNSITLKEVWHEVYQAIRRIIERKKKMTEIERLNHHTFWNNLVGDCLSNVSHPCNVKIVGPGDLKITPVKEEINKRKEII